MFRVIFVQAVVILLTALGAWLLVGTKGGISAVLGGLVCVVPNFLFALHLKAVAKKGRGFYAAHFLLGELIKLVLTIGLLLLVVKLFADLHWPSMLIALILALQTVFFAFWIKN